MQCTHLYKQVGNASIEQHRERLVTPPPESIVNAGARAGSVHRTQPAAVAPLPVRVLLADGVRGTTAWFMRPRTQSRCSDTRRCQDERQPGSTTAVVEHAGVSTRVLSGRRLRDLSETRVQHQLRVHHGGSVQPVVAAVPRGRR
jgi:hypothetical protein